MRLTFIPVEEAREEVLYVAPNAASITVTTATIIIAGAIAVVTVVAIVTTASAAATASAAGVDAVNGTAGNVATVEALGISLGHHAIV
jgi:hypothetical protein